MLSTSLTYINTLLFWYRLKQIHRLQKPPRNPVSNDTIYQHVDSKSIVLIVASIWTLFLLQFGISLLQFDISIHSLSFQWYVSFPLQQEAEHIFHKKKNLIMRSMVNSSFCRPQRFGNRNQRRMTQLFFFLSPSFLQVYYQNKH